MYRLIRREPLVVLYGKSGLGKSSLLNAGIIPECIKEHLYTPIVIRFGAWTEGATHTPLSIVKTAFTEGYSSKTFLDELLPDDHSLWSIAKNRQLNGGGQPLLSFDQFEELFSYSDADIVAFQQELSELLTTGIPLRLPKAVGFEYQSQRFRRRTPRSPIEARSCLQFVPIECTYWTGFTFICPMCCAIVMN